MKSNYKRLGDYIRQVDVRSQDELAFTIKDIVGISSISKSFVETKANLIDVTTKGYKIVEKNQFAFNPNTARMGDRIPIALNTENNKLLVSSIYYVFEIFNNSLLPKYLMLWFKRSEFDRYARFHSHGSAREIFGWEEMCNVELPIPSIEEQQKIVNAYQTIENRISLKLKLNDNIEASAFTIFQEYFASYYNLPKLPVDWKMVNLEKLCTVKSGKRLPVDSELLDIPTKHPYIRVRDIGRNRYVCLTKRFQYIDEETHSAISRYTVNTGDIILSIVGTIGLVGKIHSSLHKANLTENCVKLADINTVTSDYLYYTLCYKKKIKELEQMTVGAVQSKLPIYNIQSIKILVPPIKKIADFQNKINVFNKIMEVNMVEIQRLYEIQEALLSRIST